jgi:hypothetical protein
MDDPKTIWFRYKFTLDNGRQSTFEIHLDPQTLTIIRPPNPEPPPEWTSLAYSPCDHCPLPAEARHCPIAVNFSDVVKEFNDVLSFRKADVVVETRERRYEKSGPVQEMLFPLIGIYMSGSGCPSMEKFKPLLAHHLPFSSSQETIYRVITMFVTAQWMRMKNGLEPDFDLKGLGELYDEINQVNRDFCRRLNKAVKEDAVVNSVVILDTLGAIVKRPTAKSNQELMNLFAPFLKKPS